MALKDWKEVSNPFAKKTFKKGNHYLIIKHQYYTRNTAYWDVILHATKEKIGYKLKTYKQAMNIANAYMRKH